MDKENHNMAEKIFKLQDNTVNPPNVEYFSNLETAEELQLKLLYCRDIKATDILNDSIVIEEINVIKTTAKEEMDDFYSKYPGIEEGYKKWKTARLDGQIAFLLKNNQELQKLSEKRRKLDE